MIDKKDFIESLHGNWIMQMDMNGYDSDGMYKPKEEEGQFTPEEENQYIQSIMNLYKPVGMNIKEII